LREQAVSDEQPERDILADLRWRGLIALSTDEHQLGKALSNGPITFYVGFDPTAPSLHIGNLIQLVTARRIQNAGHRPIVLVGGSTGLIGDPKATTERSLNDPAVVARWAEKLRSQLQRYFDFSGSYPALIVNNLDWTASLSTIDFLRDIGRHFRIGNMLSKEVVSARLNSDVGISFTEFSYQLLQAYDFLELFRAHGCSLQVGGSDQWGNITAGLDLIKRVERQSAHALATPLVVKADGTKFGKTETGTVWLDPQLTSPYSFYQFWLNVEDAKVVEYLKAFSFRSRPQIQRLKVDAAELPQSRLAQHSLAEEMTALVHGSEVASRVIAASRALFGQGDLSSLDEGTLRAALNEIGIVKVKGLLTVAELFAEAQLSPGRTAARRTIWQGGAYINNRKVTAEDHVPSREDLLHGRWLVLRRGKRTVAAVEVRGRTPGA
jgi:tyrosyl-tRNA synthetase